MSALSYNDCRDILLADGSKVTMLFEGEPGIGKTRLGQDVADSYLGGVPFAFINMADMSLGDTMLPVANRELKCAEYWPNEIFQLHSGGPVCIMLDEWTKATKEAKNMTLPLALERRLGSIHLHPDSIVFATGNMSGNGLGDSIQAHQRNRFIPVRMAKPTADEWINNFAIPNQIDPMVIAFVDQYPRCLMPYEDDPDGENLYIFNPKKAQQAFVTPRSLEFASDIVKSKSKKSPTALQAQLTGAIGASGAADLTAFIHLDEQIPPIASILSNPMTTALPANPIARLVLLFNLVVRSEVDNVQPILQYLSRFNSEMRGLFMNKMLGTPSKSKWAVKVPEFKTAVHADAHLF